MDDETFGGEVKVAESPLIAGILVLILVLAVADGALGETDCSAAPIDPVFVLPSADGGYGLAGGQLSYKIPRALFRHSFPWPAS